MHPEMKHRFHGQEGNEGHRHPPFFLFLLVPFTMAMVISHIGRHHWEERRQYMEENVPPMFTRWHNLAHESQTGSKAEPQSEPQAE